MRLLLLLFCLAGALGASMSCAAVTPDPVPAAVEPPPPEMRGVPQGVGVPTLPIERGQWVSGRTSDNDFGIAVYANLYFARYAYYARKGERVTVQVSPESFTGEVRIHVDVFPARGRLGAQHHDTVTHGPRLTQDKWIWFQVNSDAPGQQYRVRVLVD
jgi:hypothetical protein